MAVLPVQFFGHVATETRDVAPSATPVVIARANPNRTVLMVSFAAPAAGGFPETWQVRPAIAEGVVGVTCAQNQHIRFGWTDYGPAVGHEWLAVTTNATTALYVLEAYWRR